MADITQRDVMLLFTMALAIVSMSFVFPSLGLADESVDANDIPEFAIDTSRFDFTSEFPDAPGSPSTGELAWVEEREDQLNQVWLRGDTSGGVEMVLLAPTAEDDPVEVLINEWNSSSAVEDTDTFTFNESDLDEEQVFVDEELGFRLRLEPLTIDRDAGEYVVRYEVIAQQVDAGWLEGVPVIGGVVEGTQATAATLVWFAEVAVWAVTYLFELIANAAGIAADVTTYLVGLLTWMSTTYAAVVASAGSWVAVFVALPGIIFSTVLGKLIIIGIGLLPTT